MRCMPIGLVSSVGFLPRWISDSDAVDERNKRWIHESSQILDSGSERRQRRSMERQCKKSQILQISVSKIVKQVKMAAVSQYKELVRRTATDVVDTNSLTGT